VADVIASVRFAQEHRLLTAVRGGGHNVAGFGTCDGGMVIDLLPMRGVHVVPRSGITRVQAGATWFDADRETQVFGLAVPGGIVSTTGVAGLTLGGGQGWLRRTYGMACDNLLSADVVNAEGECVRASEAENPDLFWALRGGGGNFGVVTSFEFRAHPVGPTVAFAGPTYPLESASSVIAGMKAFAADAPDEVNLSATWWTIPAVSDFPSEVHGRSVITLGAAYIGPLEQGERILEPLRRIEATVLDLSGRLPYTALQRMFDPFFPAETLRYYWKAVYLASLADDAVRVIADHVASRPSPMSMAGLWSLGGALGRVDAAATAAGTRAAPFLLEILANWADPAESDANIRWAREFFAAMQPFSTGKTNFNFPGLGEDTGFIRAAIGEQWTRLVELKKKYDPTNLFRLNQNIDPHSA
jgi:FAD/FMN-containing dehydrogenase